MEIIKEKEKQTRTDCDNNLKEMAGRKIQENQGITMFQAMKNDFKMRTKMETSSSKLEGNFDFFYVKSWD